jgi:hypothetical protein
VFPAQKAHAILFFRSGTAHLPSWTALPRFQISVTYSQAPVTTFGENLQDAKDARSSIGLSGAIESLVESF